MAAPVFRKVALDRLSSPEQLDTLLQVSSPRSWLALLAVLALVAAAIAWSVVGSIPTKFEAPAMLIRPGGLFNAHSAGSGRVATVVVKEGDRVREGQLVATIEQTSLTKEIENARAQLEELRAQHRQTASYASQTLTLHDDSLTLQRRTLETTIQFAEQQQAALKEQLANEEKLLDRGLVTRQRVLQTRQSIFQTTDQLERARNDLKQLAVADLSNRSQKDQELARSEMAINDAVRRLAVMERTLQVQSHVTSPADGVVVEVTVDPGGVVSAGAPVLSLQAAQEAAGLEAVIYVPPAHGKSVAPGMAVQISPLGSPREEYGFIVASVTYVSEFPATNEGMMRVLSNASLVQSLSSGGAPFTVYASLAPDPAAASGVRWSSARGGELSVNSGTLCTASIVTREQRPIELVVPYLRWFVGR